MTKIVDIEERPAKLLPGYVGNLTDEQTDKLREMWKGFFDCCDKATGSASKKEAGAKPDTSDGWESDPKKAGIPKGDDAKAAAQLQEEQAEMQALLKQYGSNALRDAFWQFVKFDNPDTAMLRFLRARKWDVSRALAMLAACLKWRLDNDIETLARQGDLGNGKLEKFLDQQRSHKTYALGTTSGQLPVCYIHVRLHLTSGQPAKSLQTYVAYAMESFRLLMVPPWDKVVLVFDLNGFGLKNMDWGCILYIVKCLQSYYPESLGCLYIHSAPFIFKGIWMILGPLLDPVVREKVVFTKGPADLAKDVPMNRLVKKVGGECESEFNFIEPKEGENDLQKDETKKQEVFGKYMELASEYEKVTKDWADNSSDNGKLDERRKILVKKLRLQQFECEPYFRGLTVYHRQGTLGKDRYSQGIVRWYYEQPDGTTQRHVVGRKYCAATLMREVAELEKGSSIADVEAKTDEAISSSDWTKLYGDSETAQNVEGTEGLSSAATDGKGTAAGGGEENFHEAPVASKAAVEKVPDAAERAPKEALAAETAA